MADLQHKLSEYSISKGEGVINTPFLFYGIPPVNSDSFLYISEKFQVEQYRISFIGAGRVAGALAKELYNRGFIIREVASKTGSGARNLADLCNASPNYDLAFTGADIIVVAVPDDAVKGVLEQLRCDEDTIVVHTTGSLGLDIFPAHLRRTGVFYPLQTFSEGRCLEFSKIPFFLETSDPSVSAVLKNMAGSIGGEVHFIDARSRSLLHVAAVFVSNFNNYMLTAGKKIASEAGFGLEILQPLINETIQKAFEKGPEFSQTGPAIRNDKGTIEKHIDLLSFSPDLQNLYREVTKSLMSFYKKGD